MGQHVTLWDLGPSKLPLLLPCHVLSLPKLPFNLISVSKLTRDLNCCILFFPNHCLFCDLGTHKVIGKERVIGDLYPWWIWASICCLLKCLVSIWSTLLIGTSFFTLFKEALSPAFNLIHSDGDYVPLFLKLDISTFVIFVDYFSRITCIYFMKSHSELFTHFVPFVPFVPKVKLNSMLQYVF